MTGRLYRGKGAS